MTSLIDTFSSKLFSYDASRRRFSSEASSLRGRSGIVALLRVRSERTQEVKTFQLIDTHRSTEGEIESWQYTISENEVARDSSLRGLTLVVFND